MHWLYFLASLLCLASAMRTTLPSWAVLLLLLLTLGFLIAWMVGWMAARVTGIARNDANIVSGDELRRLRAEAEARKATTASAEKDRTNESG